MVCLGRGMSKTLRVWVLSALVPLAASINGCSDTVDEVTNSITCGEVCERYADCFDADYDVDGCTDRCESRAMNDEDRERRLEMCETCIDDRSCSEATFDCTDDCLGIVP